MSHDVRRAAGQTRQGPGAPAPTPGGPSAADGAERERVALARAMAYLHRHFRRGPSLDELSRAVHYSPFHLHRRFRQHFGATPKQVVAALQVEEAKRLLLDGVRPAEVATAVGFAHQSHLTARFRQHVGLPPARWCRERQQQRATAGPRGA